MFGQDINNFLTISLIVCLLALQLLSFSGCAIVTIPIYSRVYPLTEKTISGKGKNKILLIDISGIISNKERSNLLGTKHEVNIVARIKEELVKAEKDDDIKGLILKIDSPGGTVSATDNIYYEIMEFKKKKKVTVIACLDNIAASGGYYIASAADEIITYPTVITGSIGVVVLRFNITGLLGKVGVEEVTIKSGENKDIMSIFKEISPEEKEILQNIIDSLYNRFLEVVAKARPELSVKDIEKIADGRIYTASEALNLKLVDKIGHINDAIKLIKEEAGLKETRLVVYKRPYAYKPNIYSKSINALSSTPSPIINIDLSLLDESLIPQFMYIWKP